MIPRRKTVSVLYPPSPLRAVTSDGSGGVTAEKKRPSPGMLFLRDAGIAAAFVVSVLLAMYAYTGLWPPLVVVESNSMMHSEDNTSYLGVIDTGDMVLVRDVDRPDDIVTYMEGFVTGHRTYGDYGDVIVYKKGGDDSLTPIIHRAMLYLEINPNGSYRCEALRDAPAEKWSALGDDNAWDYLTGTVVIHDVGFRSASVSVNIGSILTWGANSDGFITKGDYNSNIDQAYRATSTPVEIDWVVGKARGEIPWFGLLKLWVTDSLKSEAPEKSVHSLWIAIAVIVVTPIIIDVILTYRVRKKIAQRRKAAQAEYEMDRAKSDGPPFDSGDKPAAPEGGPTGEDEPSEPT